MENNRMPQPPGSQVPPEEHEDAPEMPALPPIVPPVKSPVAGGIPANRVAPNASQTVVVEKQGDIEVVALQPGFHGQVRKNEGDVFSISSMKQLGSWMALKDPKLEAARRAQMATKKAAHAAKLEAEKAAKIAGK